jgi:hypothetical protein
MQKGFPSKCSKKYAGETILKSDKVDLRLNSVRRKKEVHLMLI